MNLKRIVAVLAVLILLTGVADADDILDVVLTESLECDIIDAEIALEDLEIGTVPLEFGSMDKRPYTGAIVVHHTGMRDTDMTVAEIHDLHVNQNKWSGIGYHFVVHKDGTIEHGRPLEALGAHALSNNQFTVGICLTGNYDIGKPNETQLFSAEQLIVALCDKYKIEPDDMSIFGHRDLCPTSCPGKSLYSLLPEIIENVQKVF